MHPTHTLPTRRQIAARGLVGLGATAATGGALALIYRQWGIGVPCPFLHITGLWCPFCGGTRMAASLLEGDVVSAVQWNAFALVVVIIAAAQGVAWLVELLGGPQPTLSKRLARISMRWWIIAATSVMTLWVVLRNLPIW